VTIKSYYMKGKHVKRHYPWIEFIFSIPFCIPIAKALSKTRVHPNIISLMTFPVAIFAGYMFAMGRFVEGALFYWLGYILDDVDGNLARMTNKVSKFGSRLDYFGDVFNTLVMYAGLWYGLYYVIGSGGFGLKIIVFHYILMFSSHIIFEDGDFTYKTIHPKIFSYYSPYEEAILTFFFLPMATIFYKDAILVGLPLLILMQMISFMLIFAWKGDVKNIKKRIKAMMKL